MAAVKEPFNLIICGVGGQGNILASGLVGRAATAAGYRVSLGETYGASQRGGSVMSHLRFSREKEYGPLIPGGEAHVIAGFEPLETLRVAGNYARPDAKIIVNTEPLYPMAVVLQETEYPSVNKLLEGLASLAEQLFFINATELARQAGDPRVQNVVMVSALAASGLLPFDRQYFQETAAEFLEEIPEKNRELNRRAFTAPVKLEKWQKTGE